MSETPGGPTVLSVRGLRIETTRGTEIVDDVSFRVPRGKVVGVVGESGCGKTSTALALLNFARLGTRIAAGSVVLDGIDVLAARGAALERLRGGSISYVPQDPTAGLNPRHRIGGQIAEALTVHGARGSTLAGAVGEVVERVHLPATREFLRRYPFELSGGQQQRVAIAMAVVARPAVVVLDEPTTGLDVVTQARILALLRELATSFGTSFVYVTHDLAVVDGLADEVVVMYAGRVVETGDRAEVFASPKHPYTVLMLQAVPRIAVRRRLIGIPGTAPLPGQRPSACFFAPRCPLARERCRAESPPLAEVGPGRTARCFYASEVFAPRRMEATDENADRGAAGVLAVTDLIAAHGSGSDQRVVLQGVSFTLYTKDCLALVGESGSGKTTLGRCLVGLHRPESGLVELHGTSLAPAAAERTLAQRRAIQIIFQNPDRSLNPAETVGEALQRPLRLFGRSGGDPAIEHREAEQLLERVRLSPRLLRRYPRELSGGERQRVAIARALAPSPQVLVCDEVTSALDVSIQAAVVEILDELRSDGLSLLFITHNLALVNSMGGRIAILEEGRICETGSALEVIRKPAQPYTQRLVGAVPELRAGDARDESRAEVRR